MLQVRRLAAGLAELQRKPCGGGEMPRRTVSTSDTAAAAGASPFAPGAARRLRAPLPGPPATPELPQGPAFGAEGLSVRRRVPAAATVGGAQGPQAPGHRLPPGVEQGHRGPALHCRPGWAARGRRPPEPDPAPRSGAPARPPTPDSKSRPGRLPPDPSPASAPRRPSTCPEVCVPPARGGVQAEKPRVCPPAGRAASAERDRLAVRPRPAAARHASPAGRDPGAPAAAGPGGSCSLPPGGAGAGTRARTTAPRRPRGRADRTGAGGGAGVRESAPHSEGEPCSASSREGSGLGSALPRTEGAFASDTVWCASRAAEAGDAGPSSECLGAEGSGPSPGRARGHALPSGRRTEHTRGARQQARASASPLPEVRHWPGPALVALPGPYVAQPGLGTQSVAMETEAAAGGGGKRMGGLRAPVGSELGRGVSGHHARAFPAPRPAETGPPTAAWTLRVGLLYCANQASFLALSFLCSLESLLTWYFS